MKKPKPILIIIVLTVLLSVLFFFFPLDGIVRNIPILRGFYKNTTLEIVTLNGKASVKVGRKEYGETPVNVTNLIAGKYDIELRRVSDENTFYKPHIFHIELSKNSTSRINIEIGPDDNLHGVVLYYLQDNTIEEGKGQMLVTSSADSAKIYINNEYLDTAPVTNALLGKGEYTIKFVSTDYIDLEFPIVISEGHILNIKGYQFPIPVTFEEEDSNE